MTQRCSGPTPTQRTDTRRHVAKLGYEGTGFRLVGGAGTLPAQLGQATLFLYTLCEPPNSVYKPFRALTRQEATRRYNQRHGTPRPSLAAPDLHLTPSPRLTSSSRSPNKTIRHSLFIPQSQNKSLDHCSRTWSAPEMLPGLASREVRAMAVVVRTKQISRAA